MQTWLSNPETNFGWLLISQGEGTAKTARHFGAREDAGNAPRLVIDFSSRRRQRAIHCPPTPKPERVRRRHRDS